MTALGVWILANAAAAHQIVAGALFHDLREILDEDAGTDFFPVGWVRGEKPWLADGLNVAGTRTLWVRVPGEGFLHDRKRPNNPRAQPPGTPPRKRKRKR